MWAASAPSGVFATSSHLPASQHAPSQPAPSSLGSVTLNPQPQHQHETAARITTRAVSSPPPPSSARATPAGGGAGGGGSTATAGNEGKQHAEAPGSPERPTVRKLARPASLSLLGGSKSLLGSQGARSSLGNDGGSGGGGYPAQRDIVPFDREALVLREEAPRTAPVRTPTT